MYISIMYVSKSHFIIRIFYFLVLIFSAKETDGNAAFIMPCPPNRPDCILRSAQTAARRLADGIPELGIKPLDPLQVPYIKSTNSELSLIFRDSVITGLRTCQLHNVTQDLDIGVQSITAKCTVRLAGQYHALGRVLLLPIRGNGNCTIDIREILIKTDIYFLTVRGEKDGKRHWIIKKWDHIYRTKGGAEFKFKNLFNGNKVLAEPVEKFLNTNWQEVMTEVAPPIVKGIISYVIEAIITLYKMTPLDDLIVD